jgi:Lipocalin-like domain
MGCIVIGGGRLAVMMIDWRHDVPGGQKREYSGYTGTYTYDGKQLVTAVDASPAPDRIGTKQVRAVRFENGLMILIPPSRVVDGVTEYREIAWQKVSDV